MDDATASFRRKARFVVELRYPAIPRLFDRRGEILHRLHPDLEQEFPTWQTNSGKIQFVDDKENPTAQFWFTHMRTAVVLEQPIEIDQFIERADRYLRMMFDELGEDLTELERCGVRITEVLTSEIFASYDAANQRVISRFLPNLPAEELTYVDAGVRVVHEFGSYQIGPVGEGETWISDAFSQPDVDVPEFGIGLDVDSYRKELEIHTAQNLLDAFHAVCNLTKEVEEAVAEQAGLL